MTEATGYEAMTIHRMLEINGEADRERDMKRKMHPCLNAMRVIH